MPPSALEASDDGASQPVCITFDNLCFGATLRGRAGVIRCATCGERLVPTIDGKRPCRVCAGEMPPAADAPRTPIVPRRPVKWREPSDVSPVARDVIARVYKATRDTPGS